MKKILVFVMCLTLLLALPMPAMAYSGVEYLIPETDVYITIPEGYLVITKDMKAGNADIFKWGLSFEDVEEYFSDGTVSLAAWDEKFDRHIWISVEEGSGEDFRTLSPEVLEDVLKDLEEYNTEQGFRVSNTGVVSVSGMKYTVMECDYFLDDEVNKVLFYLTEVNGKIIEVYLMSNSGESFEKIKELAPAIISSIRCPAASSGEGTESADAVYDGGNYAEFMYMDSNTGTVFQVPAGWFQSVSDREQEPLDTVFRNADRENCSIAYGSTEIQPEEDGFPGEGELDKESLAGRVGVSPDDIYTMRMGEQLYYTYMTEHNQAADDDLEESIKRLLWLEEDGHLYTYEYIGPPTGRTYDDFVRLVSSASYPSRSPAAASGQNLFSALILTAAFYTLPIVIFRFVIRKRPMDKKRAQIVTVIYGIFAYVAVSILIFSISGEVAGGSILLWSCVNYQILIRGGDKREVCHDKEKKADDHRKAESQTYQTSMREHEKAEQIYCPRCGAVLRENDRYCSQCGADIASITGQEQTYGPEIP